MKRVRAPIEKTGGAQSGKEGLPSRAKRVYPESWGGTKGGGKSFQKKEEEKRHGKTGVQQHMKKSSGETVKKNWAQRDLSKQ